MWAGRFGQYGQMTTANPTSPAIVADELTRTFVAGRRRDRREVRAVDGISLQVEAGERVAFIGPNGAGKSTSIKMLTGILHPTSGTALVDGLVPWQERRRLAGRIGTLFGQRSQLWPELPSRAAYGMLAAIHGIDDRSAERRVAELGELLGAADLFDQPVRTLSLGQRMRCELAAALLHDPRILLLDEPSIGLDLVAKRRFRDLLVSLNRNRGTTIFLTSHDVADIEVVADRTVIVNHGRIIVDDTVDALRRTLLASKRVDVGLHHGVDPAAIDVRGATLTESGATRLTFDVDTGVRPIRDVVADLLDLLPVADLSVLDPPLEDVIADAYGDDAGEPVSTAPTPDLDPAESGPGT